MKLTLTREQCFLDCFFLRVFEHSSQTHINKPSKKLYNTAHSLSSHIHELSVCLKAHIHSSIWWGLIQSLRASLEEISSKLCSSLSTQTHILWQKIRCWPYSQYEGLLRAGTIFDYWWGHYTTSISRQQKVLVSNTACLREFRTMESRSTKEVLILKA